MLKQFLSGLPLVAGVIFTLTACGGGGSDSGDTQAANVDTNRAGDNRVTTTLTFMEINDLHAHLTAHTDVERQNNSAHIVHRGGVARIATILEDVRAENPNTIVMNIGDTYHGGVEATYTQGNAVVDPVNALGIDIGVPGNWDFAYGPGVTRRRYTDTSDQFTVGVDNIKQPNFPNLAANVTYSAPPRQAGEPFLPPTLLKQVGNIQVGFIGLTSDIVPRMHELLAAGLDFVQGETAYLALIEQHANELRRQGAQLVVVMSELGIHKDFYLANRFPAGLVDVVFSAHTHELTTEPLITNSGTWVVEPGNDTVLGRMDITFENGLVTAKNWQVIYVENTIAQSASVKALVDAERAPFLQASAEQPLYADGSSNLELTQPIDTVLGHIDSGTDRRNALVNPFNRAFTQMLRHYSATQVAITPGFRYDAVIPATQQNYEDPAIVAGSMTIEDAYRFFPVPFTLSTASVSGQHLKEVMESNLSAVFSTDIFNHSGGWFDGYDGVEISLDLAQADNQRILDLRLMDSGESIVDDAVYNVSGCSRPFDMEGDTTLCSYAGFDQVTPLVNSDTGNAWTGVEFLIYGVSNGLFPMSVDANISDNNNTSLWPQQEFYQPLQGVQ